MKYKIGIVEDDIKIAELLKAHLKKYGFEIWICNDFTNVAEHVLKHHLQLLLLDINLPCYDGFFWCKKSAGTVRFLLFFYLHEAWI